METNRIETKVQNWSGSRRPYRGVVEVTNNGELIARYVSGGCSSNGSAQAWANHKAAQVSVALAARVNADGTSSPSPSVAAKGVQS